MEYDASSIKVLTGLEAVRLRLAMYWGCGADDPDLPARVLGRVVEDRLEAEPAAPPLRVTVTVLDGRRFCVEDNAAEWGPVPGDVPSLATRLATALTGVHGSGRRGWGAAVPLAVAMCSETVADIQITGRIHRQRVGGDGRIDPPEDLGPSEPRHSRTVLEFVLDDGLIPVSSIIPAPADLVALLSDHLHAAPGIAPGTELRLHDHRSGGSWSLVRGEAAEE